MRGSLKADDKRPWFCQGNNILPYQVSRQVQYSAIPCSTPREWLKESLPTSQMETLRSWRPHLAQVSQGPLQSQEFTQFHYHSQGGPTTGGRKAPCGTTSF